MSAPSISFHERAHDTAPPALLGADRPRYRRDRRERTFEKRASRVKSRCPTCETTVGWQRSCSAAVRPSCPTSRTRDRRINRYYDPTTGQFISVDPMVASTGQAYAGFGGNPVNSSDPLGLCNGPDGICTNQSTGEMNSNSSDDQSDWSAPSGGSAGNRFVQQSGFVPPAPPTSSSQPSPGPGSQMPNPTTGAKPNSTLMDLPGVSAIPLCQSELGCVCPRTSKCIDGFGLMPLYGPPAPIPAYRPPPGPFSGLSGFVNAVSTTLAYAANCAWVGSWGAAFGTVVAPGPGTVGLAVAGCAGGLYATYEDAPVPPNAPGPNG
jgi:hypothetical protein